MKKLLLILLCLPMIGFAQDQKNNLQSITTDLNGSFSVSIEENKIDATTILREFNSLVNLSEDHTFEKYYEEDDNLGFTHFRYLQKLNGYPIELSRYNVHVKDKSIVSMNGVLFSDENISGIQLSESDALSKALGFINAEKYNWEDTGKPYSPKAELVVINKDGDINKELVLSYKFDIYASEPLSRTDVYINASSGEIVWSQNRLHNTDVTGTANTQYSGSKTITCDLYNGSYRLQETGRGNGIQTYTLNNGTSTGSAYDITSSSTTWDYCHSTSKAALDAHWGAEMTYDYFLNEHARNSIDDNGMIIKSYVHYGTNVVNAYWDGSAMLYGDGSSNPLTTIAIVGHEITHGITQHTAGLIYQGTSGALNESFSDIFGVTIDFTTRPNELNIVIIF
jgi:Zn-dependent metalloprotease